MVNNVAKSPVRDIPRKLSEIRTVVTIRRQDFDEMTEDEKRLVYKDHHIHVSGKRLPGRELYGIDSWQSRNIEAILDCSMLRQCRGEFCMLVAGNFTYRSTTDNTTGDPKKVFSSASLAQIMKKRLNMQEHRKDWIHWEIDRTQRDGFLILPDDHPLKIKEGSTPKTKPKPHPIWCLTLADIPLTGAMLAL